MQAASSLGLSAPPMLPTSLDSAIHGKATSKDAGQAFESMFASMLVKQMRQTLAPGQGLFSHDQSDILGGLFDHYIGQHVAQKGALGISDLIQKHMDRRSAAAQI